eukprot:2682745-Amphidinium_carterae.1
MSTSQVCNIVHTFCQCLKRLNWPLQAKSLDTPEEARLGGPFLELYTGRAAVHAYRCPVSACLVAGVFMDNVVPGKRTAVEATASEKKLIRVHALLLRLATMELCVAFVLMLSAPDA